MAENTYELASFPNMLSSASNKSDSRVNLTTAANRSHSELNQRKPQSTGKMCAMMLVALIAVLAILVLAGVVALILFNPQTTESNSEIETLKQQMESLRMTLTQIQQTNASSIQGTSREELSRQAIKDMLDISNQELQLQMNKLHLQINSSIQELQNQNKVGNIDLHAIINEIKANMTTRLADFQHQIINSSVEVQLRLEALTERANKSATDIQVFQLEVRANNTAYQLEISNWQEDLHELRSTINTTQIELNEKLINVKESLSETFNLQLTQIESQTNLTRSRLNNQITNITTILNEVVSPRLRKVESQVNLTLHNLGQIYFEIPSVLENATTPLVMNINQLANWTNKSLETLKQQVHHCSNAIHDLELRFNNFQSHNNNQQNTTGSKFH